MLFAPKLPMSTFYDTLRRLKITYKKEPKYKQRSKSKREDYLNKLSKIDVKKLVYIDETGTDNDIVPLYGWSEKGTKTYAEKLAFKTSRLSMVCRLSL